MSAEAHDNPRGLIDPVALAMEASAELSTAANSGVFDHERIRRIREATAALVLETQAKALAKPSPTDQLK